MKNKKHIAMRCTQEQFEAIKPKLKGLKIEDLSSFEDCPFLTNNLRGEKDLISNIGSHDAQSRGREYVEQWNEKVFLEACGIETTPTLEEVKEYFKDAEIVECLYTKEKYNITNSIIRSDRAGYFEAWFEEKSDYCRLYKNLEYAKILTYKKIMKHNFPKDKTIVCNEKHTPEQHKEIMKMCIDYDVPVFEKTWDFNNDPEFEFLIWDGESVFKCKARHKKDYSVSLSEFKAFIRGEGKIEQPKWVRPLFNANAIFWKKWKLEHAMKSWADFHNKLDGFVPDWNDKYQDKHGLVLCKNQIKKDYYIVCNYFIFQISVSSKQRAEEMYNEFKDELDDIKW